MPVGRSQHRNPHRERHRNSGQPAGHGSTPSARPRPSGTPSTTTSPAAQTRAAGAERGRLAPVIESSVKGSDTTTKTRVGSRSSGQWEALPPPACWKPAGVVSASSRRRRRPLGRLRPPAPRRCRRRARASVSTTERTASRNAADGDHARTAAGSSLVRHLVEGRDRQPLGWRGDAPVDTLRDHRAGGQHERPELGVVELVRVLRGLFLFASIEPGRLGVRWLRGPTPERASWPISRGSRAAPQLRWRSAHRPRRLSRAGTPGVVGRSGTVRGQVRHVAIDAQASLGLSAATAARHRPRARREARPEHPTAPSHLDRDQRGWARLPQPAGPCRRPPVLVPTVFTLPTSEERALRTG